MLDQGLGPILIAPLYIVKGLLSAYQADLYFDQIRIFVLESEQNYHQ